MPQVHTPNSDQDRAELLRKTIQTGQLDHGATPPRFYIPAELLQSVIEFYNDSNAPVTGDPVVGFRNRVRDLTAKRAVRSIEIGQSDHADAVLELYIRDYWEVLKRRTVRLGHPVSVLNFFDLPQDGTVPAINSRADRRIQAQKIADGETAMVAAGFPSMSNPTMAEMVQKLSAAENELSQITPFDREVEDALAVVREQRPRANELNEEILAELRHSTRKLPSGTAREVMRSYGVEFDLLEGEEPDPTQPPQNPPAGGGGGTPPPA